MQAFFAGIEGVSLLQFIHHGIPLNKNAFGILVVFFVVTMIFAVIRQIKRKAFDTNLFWLGIVSLILALLVGLYNFRIISQAIEYSGITDPMILAPSIMEAILAVGPGILAFVIAMLGNLGAKKSSKPL